MRATLPVILCAFWFFGCASQRHVSEFSESQRREIIAAANDFALVGGTPPLAIQKLRPLEVYYHSANVMIAMHRRDRLENGQRVCYEERGYCVMPHVSSNIPGSNEHWTFKSLNSGPLGPLYEYYWKK